MGKGPVFKITNTAPKNTEDYKDGISSRNPSWCVAFVTYDNPVSIYNNVNTVQNARLSIIENDAIRVTVSRNKGSFIKEATIVLKVGEIYYPNMISPGDWVFIWMNDNQEDIDAIIAGLTGNSSSSATKANYDYNGYNSGLKFVGRVVSSGNVDTVSMSGMRVLTDTVRCQSFTEMNSSVYYTYIAKSIMLQPANQAVPGASIASFLEIEADKIFAKLDEHFREFWTVLPVEQRTPDMIIAFLYALLLGSGGDNNFVNSIKGELGTPNEIIQCPKLVGKILGLEGKSKLWELQRLIVGIQKYGNYSNKDPIGKKYSPMFDFSTDISANMFFTPYRCKGYIPDTYPPLWDNQSIWTILSQYLNNPVNEMFTSLRVGPDGKILPTITVREIPLGTNLFNSLSGSMRGLNTTKTSGIPSELPFATGPAENQLPEIDDQGNPVPVVQNQAWYDLQTSFKEIDKVKQSQVYAAQVAESLKNRTMFNNLPRWLLSESVIRSVNTTTDDARRMNFFMVWGSSKAVQFDGIQNFQDAYLIQQLLGKNFVADVFDIQRVGLRANIVETKYDFIASPADTQTNVYARLRADWFMNSHLKLYGNVVTTGITSPICEGDNVQVRGVLYHIEGLVFEGSIDVEGRKSLTTTLQVSNGMIASSLDGGETQMPTYPSQLSVDRFVIPAPGVTDMQITSKDNRDENGELKKK